MVIYGNVGGGDGGGTSAPSGDSAAAVVVVADAAEVSDGDFSKSLQQSRVCHVNVSSGDGAFT